MDLSSHSSPMLLQTKFIRSMERVVDPLLTMATPMITKSRAMCARFCVELDLTKEYPTKIYLGTETKGDFQPVVMENRPFFFLGCKKRGHDIATCGRNAGQENEPRQLRNRRASGGSTVTSVVEGNNLTRKAAKKVWRPIGITLLLSGILTINGKEDIPITRVFQRLKDNLIPITCLSLQCRFSLLFSKERSIKEK